MICFWSLLGEKKNSHSSQLPVKVYAPSAEHKAAQQDGNSTGWDAVYVPACLPACVCVCLSAWGPWVACSTFWWMFHSHPFYYDPGQATFMPVTASWSTKHGAIHGMKLATKPSKRRNNSLAGCDHNMADWIWKQMPAAGIVPVTEKTWPPRYRRQRGPPYEPQGEGRRGETNE